MASAVTTPQTKLGELEENLLQATKGGQMEMVISLLEQGALVNEKGEDGLTALCIAAATANEAMVNVLLNDPNVDVDAVTSCGNTALSIACEIGELPIVQMLLQQDAYVHKINCEGQRPLDVACYFGHWRIIEVLVSYHKTLGLVDGLNFAPVHWAAKGGHLNSIRYLFQNADDLKLNVDLEDREGNSPLHIACAEGHLEIVEELLKWREVDVEKLNHLSETPLHVACKHGRRQVLDALLRRTQNFNVFDKDGMSPLHRAVAQSSTECVETLLSVPDIETDAKAPNLNAVTPIALACDRGLVKIIKILLDKGADVNTLNRHGDTLLVDAAKKNDIHIVKCLLESPKANPNDRERAHGKTALIIATEHANDGIAKVLIKHGADVNATDVERRSPLYVACKLGLHSIAREIMSVKERKIEALTINGKMPLHVAAMMGQVDVLRVLLRGGANVDALTDQMQTALHLSIYRKHTIPSSILSWYTNNVNQVDIYGNTPLYLACDRGFASVASNLLCRGADPNITATVGKQTPLHAACARGLEGCVDLLAEVGARVCQGDEMGRTALHFAVCCQGKQDILVRLLMRHGADCMQQDHMGLSPLDLARALGHTTAVQLMITFQKPSGFPLPGLDALSFHLTGLK